MKTRTRVSRKSGAHDIARKASLHHQNTENSASHGTPNQNATKNSPKHSIACEEPGNAKQSVFTSAHDTNPIQDNSFEDINAKNSTKSRNLDLVVSRMLKAKKGDALLKACASDSNVVSNKSQCASTIRIKHIGENLSALRRVASNPIPAEGMIDIQRSGQIILENDRVDSPQATSSDNENCKQFESHCDEDKAENMTMSTLIKQEPMALQESRAEIYARQPSPASSYNSAHSAEHRTPSPKSPQDTHTDVMRHLAQNFVNAHQLHDTFNGYGSNSTAESPNKRDRSYNDDVTKGAGPPSLIPSQSAISSIEAYNTLMTHAGYRDQTYFQSPFLPHQRDANQQGIRVSPTAPLGRTPTRGIVGHKEAAAAENGGRRGSADGKCTYKRPPHTYPALIASAILDSPGNLITLRGIYDYIMNNFPYYKFGHDKSAWQNSIRHNLSLNQCFIKVPRYENAAKSNYWTMTREGFEEFGNENSFKRRRRRGATLAPISAYKNKKGNQNNENNRTKQREAYDTAAREKKLVWHSRAHTPDASTGHKALKRPCSPGSDPQAGCKNPKMLVLKHGEGPSLDGISQNPDRRPNSLSSLDEMQVNVNTFTKSLNPSSDNRNHPESPVESLKQQWMIAAAMQKNFNMFPMLPDLSSEDRNQSGTKSGSGKTPVMYDRVEIGFRTPVYFDSNGLGSKWSFHCQFCEYRNVSDSQNLLEQHFLLMHPKSHDSAAKIASGARRASDQTQERKSPGRQDASLPSMGWPPSILAPYNGHNLFATPQGSALNLPMSFASTTPFDSLARALAQQMNPNDPAHSNADHVRRLQAGSDAMSGAFAKPGDISNATQEHFRQLLYQQLMPQNPFFPGSNQAVPRPVTNHQGGDMNEIAQKILLYHQKMMELASQKGGDPSTPPHPAVSPVERNPDKANDNREARILNHGAVNTNSSKSSDRFQLASRQQSLNEEALSTSTSETSTQTCTDESKRVCTYCDITFGDDTMHALHMTCHDRSAPYRCTICDQDCHEKYYFNVHLLRGLHQPRPDSGAVSTAEIDREVTEPVSNGVPDQVE